MTAQLYVHQTTGNLALMDMSTGRVWSLPSAAWAAQLRAMRQVPDKDPVIMTAAQWDFLLDRCLEARLALAEQVWVHPVTGVDGGLQLSGLRLSAAQLDAYKGATRTVPVDASGITVKVDEASIASKVIAGVTTAVKAMFTNGGK